MNADYYIYSNSDIIVNKTFYEFIINKICRYNYDFMIINRRDNIPKFINDIRLTNEHLNLIYCLDGERHMGKDCFVIKKSILKNIYERYFYSTSSMGRNINKISKEFI